MVFYCGARLLYALSHEAEWQALSLRKNTSWTYVSRSTLDSTVRRLFRASDLQVALFRNANSNPL